MFSPCLKRFALSIPFSFLPASAGFLAEEGKKEKGMERANFKDQVSQVR